jgi:hypothetical protein
MKWKAHTRTAEKILEGFTALYFKKYEKELVNGIISPDNEDPKPHHVGREKTALDYILRAREKRLNYDTGGCFFQLGVAFHYIQDMWVGVTPEEDDYLSYLDRINRCQILDLHESLERFYPVKRRRVLEQFRSLEKRLCKPLESEAELRELVLMKRPNENSAFLDLNLSFRVCYRITELVLKTIYNVQLQESLELLKDNYTKSIKSQELQEIKRIDELMEESEKYSLDESTLGKINHWRIEKILDNKMRAYKVRDHLKPLLSWFDKEVEEICKKHENWYNIDKPLLDIDSILKIEYKQKKEKEDNYIIGHESDLKEYPLQTK